LPFGLELRAERWEKDRKRGSKVKLPPHPPCNTKTLSLKGEGKN